MDGAASTPRPSAAARLVVPVRGMTCAACVAHVERALVAVPGVSGATVNLATESAAVSAPAAALADLRAAVQRAGYEVPVERQRLALDGMTCASCVARVEAALRAVPGVLSASANLAAETATVELVAGMASGRDLERAAAAAGYPARVLVLAAAAAPADADAALRRDALLALALATPLLLPMLAAPFGLDAMPPPWLQWLLATPVQFWCARRFYRAAWRALRAGTGNMDLLVALGTSAAYGLSLVLWWQHGRAGHEPHLYFEAAAVVIALVLLGKWLETRARRRTGAAIQALAALRPATARVRRDGATAVIPLEDVRVGDRVLVHAGERIPVDGRVIDGHGSVDASMLTGESLPVECGVGSRVAAGTIDRDGGLELEVTAVGGATALAQIIRLVEDAQAAKAPIQRLVDRVAAVFVPVVLGIAALALAGGWLAGWGLEAALLNAVSVLVIACPCALGLATPAAIVAGTGVAARHGILIKDAEALELARRITLVVFDKTGTLTEGTPRVVQVLAAAGGREAEVLAAAAAVSRADTHPLAQAVRTAAALPPAPEAAPDAVGAAVAAVAAAAPPAAAAPLPATAGEQPAAGVDQLAAAAEQPAFAAQGAAAAEQPVAAGGAGAARQAPDPAGHPPAAAGRPAAPPAFSALRTVAGRGVTARAAAADGSVTTWWFGNRRWVVEQGADLSDWERCVAPLERDGCSVSWLARRAGAAGAVEVLGAVAFGDAPRAGAAAAVQRLAQLGVASAIVSGDHAGAVRRVAAQVGITAAAHIVAEARPADKARAVAAFRGAAAPAAADTAAGSLAAPAAARTRHAPVVAMVGDGSNDAPALAAADVGIAMGNGTDVALHAAGITLLRADPRLVADAIRLSRATVRTIRQNLFWAFAYNALGIPLAAVGLLSPVIAGAAMALSSVCVVGNALRLRRLRLG